ncbi:MAG: beta-galactosidase [Sphingomonas sp.]|nr:beta-galactosidase [Sphingomonas sp.]
MVQVGTSGRTSVIFNADWRFKLGDEADAQRVDFDDSGWEPVGLPHSFSMPYFQSSHFYVGYGWYRKDFLLPALARGRRLALEFEGAFQEAEIFVNGRAVGHHRGGYTGFPVDITDAVRPGRNLVAVRVNNRWDPTLAPRAGEHVFSGGIYRDVRLVATDAVHVAWTGTRLNTPELSATSGRVTAETEIRNEGSAAAIVRVRRRIEDADGRFVAALPDTRVQLAPGATAFATQRSAPIARPRLWSPETPNLYRAVTSLLVGGQERDLYPTEFGFRWFRWTADEGFFLNGRHRYFRGANVHQDQAGWGDAVTNRAIERDVQYIKDAGFDFIRGSHYPHDPHFAEATDRIGLLFLSEAPFWGTAGFKNPWGASAYPTDPSQRAAFDASVLQQLAEMIRINRNHPSIVVWGMDNEVFFSAKETLPEVRRLLKEEVALAHQLDPSRPASIDGAQRGDIDKLGDIAGYNGDGAALFPNPGIANFVAEYGSAMEDRPGSFAPGWGDLENTPGAKPGDPASWRQPWRSGEAIWAGFDHGSIAGRKFGSMGMLDYSRLPKREWYWYRNAYRGIAPPAWPQPGKPAALRLTSSAPDIRRADGTDDVQLVVTVVDAAGRPVSNSPPVRLTIEAGPGELPTGRSIDFAAASDIPIRNGQAAIAMRSWQAGVSRIRATSSGLRDGVIEIRTIEGPPFVAGVTPLVSARPYHAFKEQPDAAVEQSFGTNNPTNASSSASDHSSRMANDGNAATYWQAAPGDAQPWLLIDPERIIEYHRLQITFPAAGAYGFRAEVKGEDGAWHVIADQPAGSDEGREREVATQHLTGGALRIRIAAPPDKPAGIAELRIVGVLKNG